MDKDILNGIHKLLMEIEQLRTDMEVLKARVNHHINNTDHPHEV